MIAKGKETVGFVPLWPSAWLADAAEVISCPATGISRTLPGLDSRAGDSPEAYATIDHSDIRGLEPHGHDPSGAASD